jgi:hypothetical protein
MIFGEQFRLRFSMRSFPQAPLASSHLGPNILSGRSQHPKSFPSAEKLSVIAIKNDK